MLCQGIRAKCDPASVKRKITASMAGCFITQPPGETFSLAVRRIQVQPMGCQIERLFDVTVVDQDLRDGKNVAGIVQILARFRCGCFTSAQGHEHLQIIEESPVSPRQVEILLIAAARLQDAQANGHEFVGEPGAISFPDAVLARVTLHCCDKRRIAPALFGSRSSDQQRISAAQSIIPRLQRSCPALAFLRLKVGAEQRFSPQFAPRRQRIAGEPNHITHGVVVDPLASIQPGNRSRLQNGKRATCVIGAQKIADDLDCGHQRLSQIDDILIVVTGIVVSEQATHIGSDPALQHCQIDRQRHSAARRRSCKRRQQLFNIIDQVGMHGDQLHHESGQLFGVQRGKQAGQVWPLLHILGSVEQVQQGCHNVLAVAAQVIRTGAFGIGNGALRVKANSHTVRLVGRTDHLSGKDSLPPDDLTDCSLRKVRLPACPGLRCGAFANLLLIQIRQS
jgi:hypothetical protein